MATLIEKLLPGLYPLDDSAPERFPCPSCGFPLPMNAVVCVNCDAELSAPCGCGG